jgi:3-oxoacyl-[acyl-carrier-protein] synthase-1
MDKTESVFYKLAADETVDYTAFLQHDAGCSTELIAKKIGATYFYTTISTACSSAANAIILGAKMIQQNKLDLVFVGGVDALTSFTVEGFNSLQILDKNLCKPFDKDRNGLNLGEGAAYLVLASDKIIKEFGLTSLGTVAGFANCNDSYHQTASSPDGKGNLLVMQNAIAMSNISTQAIDYINLHGTGTANNDMAEGIAMKTLFGENVPAFSSTKSYTGHTLAACGAIEGVIALLAIKHQKAFANLRFETPIEEHQLTPINKTISKKINHVLSNSFGFGGNCSAIVFSKS